MGKLHQIQVQGSRPYLQWEIPPLHRLCANSNIINFITLRFIYIDYFGYDLAFNLIICLIYLPKKMLAQFINRDITTYILTHATCCMLYVLKTYRILMQTYCMFMENIEYLLKNIEYFV